MNYKYFTSESVCAGHPDKICDQISDAILDECLRQDPNSRVAVETFGGHGTLVVGGEVTSNANADYVAIARKIYKDIGYKERLKVIVNVAVQSPDISMGVDTGGAGDQGIMYGYATDETPEFMPKTVVLAHKLAEGLEKLRKENKNFRWLGPDGKTQITVRNGKIETILASCQHSDKVGHDFIKKEITDNLIKPIVADLKNIQVLVNPTGKFTIGGFTSDTGLTGRKIMVDTYCGLAPHGGGCFSGKDPTKVDRSGAYMARYAAKNLVANGFAKKCLVSVAYAIGKAEPLMVEALDENGRSVSRYLGKKFDFRPRSIIEQLQLKKPIYQKTAAYGHFGRSGLPWEEVIALT